MELVGVELEMLVNEQDALTTRPPPFIFGWQKDRKSSTRITLDTLHFLQIYLFLLDMLVKLCRTSS